MGAAVSRDRLAGILGMLGSNHDGEAVAAARAAERLRRELGTTWQDLLVPPSGPAPSPPPSPMGWRQAAVFCATQRRVPLSDWEMRFTHEVARYAGRP